eukprot:100075-Pleurochrysis_carterae.AAC.1
MRLKVFRRYLKAWQGQIPKYHAPALYCRASPLYCSERSRPLRSHVRLVWGVYESYPLPRQPATLE